MTISQTVQRVVRVEVNALIGDGFLAALPTDCYQREFLSTTEHYPGHINKAEATHADWWGFAEAIDAIAARALTPRPDGRPLDLHLALHAPLPLLVQLGARLTQWGPAATLHSVHGGQWYAIRTDTGVDAAGFFARVSPLDRVHHTHGWVALAIDCIGGGVDEGHISDALGGDLGDIVHVAGPAGDLTAANAARFVGHIQEVLKQYPSCYPAAAGLAIFFRGPAPAAVLLGRQLNTATHKAVRLYDFDQKRPLHYQLAVTLPRGSRPAPAIDWSHAARLRRQKAHAAIAAGLSSLQRHLTADQLPDTVPHPGKVIARLARLTLDAAPEPHDPDLGFIFEASTTGRVRFDAGLLDALSSDPQIDLGLAGQMFVLHELHHIDQRLYSSTYQGIGRAGLVLEEVDYHADAFAIGVVIDHEVSQQGPRGKARQGDIARRCIETHIRILEAFDRAEQGPRINRLPERRLRRYLIWHLQRCRVRALDGADWQASAVLSPRLAVELAPLAGHLDRRFDKIVDDPTEDTELFVTLLGHLIRVQSAPGRDVRRLVDAVRTFDGAPIEAVMQAVVDLNRALLLEWLP